MCAFLVTSSNVPSPRLWYRIFADHGSPRGPHITGTPFHRHSARSPGFGAVFTSKSTYVATKQIHLAVAIVIQKRSAASPCTAGARNARLLAHVGECSVAVVVVQDVLPVIGDLEIFVSIIVVIAHANALSPPRMRHTRLRGHIRKRSVVIVVIQVTRRRPGAWHASTPVPVVSMMYFFVSTPPNAFFATRPAFAASSLKKTIGFAS
jgi:hypothetical protein